MDFDVADRGGYSAVHNIGRNIIVDHIVGQCHTDRHGNTGSAESPCDGGCSAIGHNAGGIISG